MLVGSEVKSLRTGRVSLEEAYARVKDDEVWLVGCDIAEYIEANQFNHQSPPAPKAADASPGGEAVRPSGL